MSNIEDDDAFFNVHMFAAGRVLSDKDVADIQRVLADYNEEMGERCDEQNRIRKATLFEIGGDELVAAAEAKDDATVRAAVDKALGWFYAKRDETDFGKLEGLRQRHVRALAFLRQETDAHNDEFKDDGDARSALAVYYEALKKAAPALIGAALKNSDEARPSGPQGER